MEATLLLCDYAQTFDGKLYIMGGGWNRIPANAPISVAVAVLLHVPWDQTNRPTTVIVTLVNEDGQAVMATEDQPLRMGGQLEVGRPAGSRAGSTFNIPLTFTLPALMLPAGGYRWEVTADGEQIQTARFDVISEDGT